jgi:hypothetical protein
MPRFSSETWTPSQIEAQCLRHLDSAENWDSILKLPQPPEVQDISYRPFYRVFGFNLVLFSVTLTGVLIGAAWGTLGPQDFSETIPWLVGLAILTAAGLSGYTCYLYRRSWNRRAKQRRSSN